MASVAIAVEEDGSEGVLGQRFFSDERNAAVSFMKSEFLVKACGLRTIMMDMHHRHGYIIWVIGQLWSILEVESDGMVD